jgi:anti-sigma regulatory factor (Ser/Thr protein kinase)
VATAHSFDATWPAIPDSVGTARRSVLAHLSALETSDPPLSDIGLAVSEAVTNAVHHAYVGQEPGPVRVRVAVQPPVVEVMVQDEGSGMVPRPDSPGLGLGSPRSANGWTCERGRAAGLVCASGSASIQTTPPFKTESPGA